jgi:hypothetical protein
MRRNPIMDSSVGDGDLIDALRKGLEPSITRKRGIRKILREVSSYQSSYPLEQVTLIFDDGAPFDLVFKNVSPDAVLPTAPRTKPEFLDGPGHEIDVYQNILASRGLGTPYYYGSHIDHANNHFWLFLEKVSGQELYQIGDMSVWLSVARWLARFHSHFNRFDTQPQETGFGLKLLDRPYYQQWIARAVQFMTGAKADAERLATMQRLAEIAPRVIDELLQPPMTVIHGEFYASNVIVETAQQPIRISPLDWERTAIGPGMIDLAALVAGNWSEEVKGQMARAYHEELLLNGHSAASFTVLLRHLNLCRLQLAVQWLGWSPNWKPPAEHCQDWLAEAVTAARHLGITI